MARQQQPDTARQSPRLLASPPGVPDGGKRPVAALRHRGAAAVEDPDPRVRPHRARAWRPSPRNLAARRLGRAGDARRGAAVDRQCHCCHRWSVQQRGRSQVGLGCSRRLAISSVCGWPWRSCQSMRLLTDAIAAAHLLDATLKPRIGEAPPSRTAGGAVAADPARSVPGSSAARRTSACWRLRSAPSRSPPLQPQQRQVAQAEQQQRDQHRSAPGRAGGSGDACSSAWRVEPVCLAPSAARRAAASAARAMRGHGAGRPRRRCGPRLRLISALQPTAPSPPVGAIDPAADQQAVRGERPAGAQPAADRQQHRLRGAPSRAARPGPDRRRSDSRRRPVASAAAAVAVLQSLPPLQVAMRVQPGERAVPRPAGWSGAATAQRAPRPGADRRRGGWLRPAFWRAEAAGWRLDLDVAAGLQRRAGSAPDRPGGPAPLAAAVATTALTAASGGDPAPPAGPAAPAGGAGRPAWRHRGAAVGRGVAAAVDRGPPQVGARCSASSCTPKAGASGRLPPWPGDLRPAWGSDESASVGAQTAGRSQAVRGRCAAPRPANVRAAAGGGGGRCWLAVFVQRCALVQRRLHPGRPAWRPQAAGWIAWQWASAAACCDSLARCPPSTARCAHSSSTITSASSPGPRCERRPT